MRRPRPLGWITGHPEVTSGLPTIHSELARPRQFGLETRIVLYATPEDIHTVSRNASKMKSTKYPFHSFALGK